MLQKPFLLVICVVFPYNQHENNDHFPFEIESDGDVEMVVKWDVDGEKTEK